MLTSGAGNSEVARLMATIDAELAACRLGVNGLAAVARHDFIAARMGHTAEEGTRLIEEIGIDAAMPLLVSSMERYGNGWTPRGRP